MDVFCTYCSAHKRNELGQLPSIERYIDKRINDVYASATLLGLEFRILSGKYGLLKPEQPIEFYDHLLTENEVSEHSVLVAKQLAEHGITSVSFFSLSVVSDPNVICYQKCMQLAAAHAGVEFSVITLPDIYL